MKKYIILLYSLVLLPFLIQSSSQQSISKDGLKINYTGFLNSAPVEHITINGLNEKIKFYIKPADQTQNPALDSKTIDLGLIKSITLPEKKVHIAKYNGTDYMDIMVSYNDGGADPFVIETTKEIITMDDKGSERHTKFPALTSLEITGVSCKKPQPLH
jgi:hypothetical protein